MLQLKRRPTTTYMESVQGDINPMMRSILLDWLVEVGQEYRLTSDTLFLSAAFIDRFLSLVDVKRNRLQLVGVTCMLVASKYEEIYAPQVEEFCYITDNTYTREQVGGPQGLDRQGGPSRGTDVAMWRCWNHRGAASAPFGVCACQPPPAHGVHCSLCPWSPLSPSASSLQVLDMEREVLRVLDFDLTQPTIKTFLRRYNKAASGACPCLLLLLLLFCQAHHLHARMHTSTSQMPGTCPLPCTHALCPRPLTGILPPCPWLPSRFCLLQGRSLWMSPLSSCAPTWLS